MDCYSNDWDLQALVRSCGGGAASESEAAPTTRPREDNGGAPREAPASSGRPAAGKEEFLGQPVVLAPTTTTSWRDLDHLDLPFSITPPSRETTTATTTTTSGQHQQRLDQLDHEVIFSFPLAAAAVSTSGGQGQQLVRLQPRKQPARKPGARTPRRPKRSKKSQLKKVVCEVPVADGGVATDLWAWRKYGQKPINGSPYPRGYYKCSSLKSCMARKLVERSPANPGVLVVTYIADHCHAVPTMLNALAGTTRNRPAASDEAAASADNNKLDDGADAASSSMTVEDGGCCDDDNDNDAAWQVDHTALRDYPLLDDFLGPFDDDFDRFFFDDDDDVVLERRLSLSWGQPGRSRPCCERLLTAILRTDCLFSLLSIVDDLYLLNSSFGYWEIRAWRTSWCSVATRAVFSSRFGSGRMHCVALNTHCSISFVFGKICPNFE